MFLCDEPSQQPPRDRVQELLCYRTSGLAETVQCVSDMTEKREELWCGRMAEEKRMFAWQSRIARAILWWILQDPQSAFVEMVHTTHLVDADMAGERKAGGVILSSARKIPHFTKDVSGVSGDRPEVIQAPDLQDCFL
uniref:Uncharacterized protein n=1 Tax=Vespula pensylvanica TaxID=30213 RepID=A0A834UGE2_VESPE|nr:hypothetical protein H0235_001027 [Vespula pensylvanica]